jgi:hypothetical protein
MKNLYQITLLLFVISLLFSCDKNETNTNQFTGTWTLKKFLADPGDGSGKYVDVSQNPIKTLTFTSNGNIFSNTSFFNLDHLNEYEILDSNKVKVKFKLESSQSPSIYSYQFKKDTLILSPMCIEACGLKFTK